jgi:hypothetical protein
MGWNHARNRKVVLVVAVRVVQAVHLRLVVDYSQDINCSCDRRVFQEECLTAEQIPVAAAVLSCEGVVIHGPVAKSPLRRW